jgi:hypothetical protein
LLFETRYHSITQAGLELGILLSQPPEITASQHWQEPHFCIAFVNLWGQEPYFCMCARTHTHTHTHTDFFFFFWQGRGNRCHSLDKLQKQFGSWLPWRSLTWVSWENSRSTSFRQELSFRVTEKT